jgi:hypothetical protein
MTINLEKTEILFKHKLGKDPFMVLFFIPTKQHKKGQQTNRLFNVSTTTYKIEKIYLK